MRTDTRPTKTPRQRADYYEAKAAAEDQIAAECAAIRDRRGQRWHMRNAASYRTQSEFIIESAKGVA